MNHKLGHPSSTKASNVPGHKAVKLDLTIISEKCGPGIRKKRNMSSLSKT